MQSPSVKEKRKHKVKSNKFTDLNELYDKLINRNKGKEKPLAFDNLKEFPELNQSNQISICNKKKEVVESLEDFDNNFDKEFPCLPKINTWINEIKDLEPCKIKSDSTVPCKNENKKNNKLLQEKIKTHPVNTETSKKNIKKKKRAGPILIDLNEILEAKKKKEKKPRKVVKTKYHRFRDKGEILSGNPLDSSKPKRKRGKQREVKKKKLTKLKVAIVKERIIKQKQKENTKQELGDLIKDIDFTEEIKKYLQELKKKKIKKVEELVAEKKNKSENLPVEKKVLNEENQNVEGCLTEIKFSSKFKQYCDNIITPSLNSAVTELIKAVVSLQDKLFARNPLKAQAKRNHVSGFKEVKKYLILKKVKMVVMAPDLEKMQMKGSIFDLIDELKSMASSQNVPYVFALNRYKLGRSTKKNVPVSAFAILNHEGANTLFQKVLEKANETKKQFLELSKPMKEPIDVNSEVISSFISNFRDILNVSDENPKG